MTRVDVIANERLLDDRHHWHELQDLWRDRPVALVFLRHFGSAFALRQAQVLSARYDEITAAGADLVLIGLGTPIQGFTFRKRARSRFRVLTTADQTLYRTMGLSREHGVSTRLRSLPSLVGLLREGVHPSQRTGDSSQLGGVFVVAAGGREVLWDFRARKASDIAAPDRVVAELKRLRGSGQ